MDGTSAPIDVLLIGFDGNEFNSQVWSALRALILRDVVRVLDILFVYKDADGQVGSDDVDALRPALERELVVIDGQFDRAVFDADDVDVIGAGLAPDRSMIVLAIENTWARPFIGAIRAAGGELIDHARVPSGAQGGA